MQQAIFERGEPEGQAAPLEDLAIHRLEEISAPTLVIVGDKDTQTIVGACELLAERIPGARKAVMQGTAHMPNMEKPDEFNQLVLDFLTAIHGSA